MIFRLPFLFAAAWAAPVLAQVAPVDPLTTPSPTPVPTATTIAPEAAAVPPPIAITLPTPVAAPSVRPSARPSPAATPRPRATPTANLSPAPTPSPMPTVFSTPTSPDLVPLPATVGAQPETALPIPPERGAPWMLPTVGGLLIALVLVAIAARRRRRAGEMAADDAVAEEPVEEPAPDLIAPAPAPLPPVAIERAWLALDLRPRRAGVNLLTATLDAELVVRNDGDAAAQDVHVVLRLLSASADQEAELAAAATDPSARAVAAPFALAPGEERVVTAIATLPRGAINVMTVGERPMFVPVAVIAARYASGDVRGESAAAFALGVERAGAEKLAPFWLDAASRMHDAVGARPHGLSIRR